MLIYLDNCCYNRPFDDLTQQRIFLEAQAKIYVQEMIREHRIELVSSYVLSSENARNPYELKRRAIQQFLEDNTAVYVDITHSDEAEKIAARILSSGIKPADALHIACALMAKCDYFLTTDDRLLKYRADSMQIVNPIDFVSVIGGPEWIILKQ